MAVGSYTTAPTTYYVNPVTGRDTNDGLTSSNPFRTLQRALDKIFKTPNIFHTQTVYVAAGTLVDPSITVPPFVLLGASIDVIGTLENFTPAAGISSGTFDSSFGTQTYIQTAVVSGAGWTPDSLRGGVFVQVTSGPSNEVCIPILSNTPTTVDLAIPVTTMAHGGIDLRGQTFRLVRPGTVAAAADANWLVARGIQGRLVYSSGIPSFSTRGLVNRLVNFQRIRFTRTAGAFQLVLTQNATLGFSECMFLDTGGDGGGLLGLQSNSSVAVGRSLIWANNNSTQGIQIRGNSQVTTGATGMDRGTVGVSLDTGRLQVDGPIVAQNYANSGIDCRGPGQSGLAAVLARNCKIGISIGGNHSVFASPSLASAFHLRSNTIGLQVGGDAASGISGSSGEMILSLIVSGAVLIEDNGTGIAFGVKGMVSMTVGSNVASIINNTTWGVNMAPALRAGFNTFQGNAGLTISGNTDGDFTLDGMTATSLASLRTLSPKRIVDANAFNRLVEL